MKKFSNYAQAALAAVPLLIGPVFRASFYEPLTSHIDTKYMSGSKEKRVDIDFVSDVRCVENDCTYRYSITNKGDEVTLTWRSLSEDFPQAANMQKLRKGEKRTIRINGDRYMKINRYPVEIHSNGEKVISAPAPAYVPDVK